MGRTSGSHPQEGPAPSRDAAAHRTERVTMAWLRKQPARTTAPGVGTPPAAQAPVAPATGQGQFAPQPVATLPERARIRRLAQFYHKQLVHARQRSGRQHEIAQAQVEALRQFARELTHEQAEAFMNMYTEESSAVEREWRAQRSTYRAKELISPVLINTLTFIVALLAIAAAILYAV